MAFKYLTGTIVPIADREWAESMPREHMPTCFGCGSENPDRLGIEPRIEGDKIGVKELRGLMSQVDLNGLEGLQRKDKS